MPSQLQTGVDNLSVKSDEERSGKSMEWPLNLPDRAPNLHAIFGDAALASDWAGAMAVHAELTRSTGPALNGGVNPGDQRALFSLVRKLRPRRVLEIGTHLGYSTIHIASALKQNGADDGVPGELTTVDIINVNSGPGAPWQKLGAVASPRSCMKALGYHSHVSFVQSSSVDFLKETDQEFDFVFLDGNHDFDCVYQELRVLNRAICEGATVLLHDYFPEGSSLWGDLPPILGPWSAVRRLQDEGAPIIPVPLGSLPWPTKLGSHITSLAILIRS